MSNELFTPILLCSASRADQKSLAAECVQRAISTAGNTRPIVIFLNETTETISIEMVRNLIGELGYAADTNHPRVIVLLAADLLSLPAQHALLKSLEEPPPHTLLILVTSNQAGLLPTIHSRCVVQYGNGVEETDTIEVVVPEVLTRLALNPTSANYADLIKLVEQYKDRAEAVELVEGLIHWTHASELLLITRVRWQQQLVVTLQQLKQNANVALAMEECLFGLKRF